MGTERGGEPRFPQHNALRIALVSGIALLGSMGLLLSAPWAQVPDDEARDHMMTITTEYDPLQDMAQMDHGSHMDASAMTHYDEGVWIDKEYRIPRDMWLTEFSTDFTGVSVHNFYLFIKDSHDTWCPENPTAIYSGGTVSAARPLTFDPPYGIFVKKGTTLVLTGLNHKMENSPDTKVSFSVHARYEPAEHSTRSVPVSLHFITPGPCAYTRPVFPIPPHAKNAVYGSEQKPFVFPDDGVIVKAMAHFHASYKKDVANTVSLFLNGKRIDSFTTTNVGDGEERNPRLLKDRLVSVNSGDILTMHAIFSNPSATPVAEGMAIIGFYFAPQNQ